ncbi:methyltransferase [Mycobacterium phage Ugenie5]|nr:methyltransferase [Mycobacterium phage Ugenie5]
MDPAINPRIGSLFSGAGGLDLAVERVFKGTTIWQSEVNKAASTVLEKRFGVPNLGDITKINWHDVPPVDILCGGFRYVPRDIVIDGTDLLIRANEHTAPLDEKRELIWSFPDDLEEFLAQS